jgi:hypothetical protein
VSALREQDEPTEIADGALEVLVSTGSPSSCAPLLDLMHRRGRELCSYSSTADPQAFGKRKYILAVHAITRWGSQDQRDDLARWIVADARTGMQGLQPARIGWLVSWQGDTRFSAGVRELVADYVRSLGNGR